MSSAGPLESALSQAGADPRIVAAAGEIDLALELSTADFSGSRNVVEVLHYRLTELPQPRSQRHANWIEALSHLIHLARRQVWKSLARGGHGGNPLGGQLRTYPIAGLLLQEPMSLPGRQPLAVLHLYLDAILGDQKRSAKGTADILRRGIAPATKLTTFLRSMPTYDGSRESLEAIYEYAIAEAPKLVGKEAEFARAISRLRVPKRRKGLSSGSGRNKRRYRYALYGPGPPTGSLEEYIRRPEDSRPEEPPASDLLHTLDTPQEPGGDVSSTEDVEASARESRQWVLAHQVAVPGMYSRFTRVEQRHFLVELSVRLGSANPVERRPAGFLLFMYLLGLDLPSVLHLTYGDDAELGPEGTFRRKIRSPPEGYVPEDHALQSLEPRSDVLLLSLPRIAVEWLSIEASEGSGTLGSVLGVEADEAKAEVKSVLGQIRAGARYQRIRQERISAALSAELALASRDPVMSHLIAGSPVQAHPILSYYLVHEISALQKLYERVALRLLNEDTL